MSRRIFITRFDRDRLLDLIDNFREQGRKLKAELDILEKELDSGKLVEPEEIPGDVVTMNSRVNLIDLDSGAEKTLTLVFPSDADMSRNRISILAPVGTALIGYRVGDVIKWKVPSGVKKLKIKEILYQPEAAGDYHL